MLSQTSIGTVAATTRYRGRFAPSPTGPLHFGSLLAAVGSFLQARKRQGHWLVRIEDLDPPREMAGAADEILRTLETYGFEWDDEVLWQSKREPHYKRALERLREIGAIYACQCSRREIVAEAEIGDEGPVYPGICRERNLPLDGGNRTIRIRVPHEPLTFLDMLQGRVRQMLSEDVGDFIVQRRDRLFAYQLAVVVDDEAQGITEVVRGADLLGSTPRQIFLQQQLGFRTPAYMHLPLAVNERGQKLSKQTGAEPLSHKAPGLMLWRALEFLRQSPPEALSAAPPADIWAWAIAHWSPSSLQRISRIAVVKSQNHVFRPLA